MTKKLWKIIDRHEDANVIISLEFCPAENPNFVIYVLDKHIWQIGAFSRSKNAKSLQKDFDNYVALAVEYEAHLFGTI